MKIKLEKAFLRHAKKLLKRNPQLKEKYEEIIEKLSNNPFDPPLHTHPLTGNLKGRYACSLTHELRLIFKLYNGILHPPDIGSHDEVY